MFASKKNIYQGRVFLLSFWSDGGENDGAGSCAWSKERSAGHVLGGCSRPCPAAGTSFRVKMECTPERLRRKKKKIVKRKIRYTFNGKILKRSEMTKYKEKDKKPSQKENKNKARGN